MLFLENLHNQRDDILNKPLQLFLEVTTQCNLRCKKCGKNFDPRRRRVHSIPFRVLSEIHDYYKGALEVNTFGYGEMFLYKDLSKLVKILKSYDCKLCGITNGTMIGEEEVSWLVASCYDELTFSIDGANAQTMKRLRGADFDGIIKTLHYIKEEKQRSLRTVPRIIINFVAQKDNFHELPDLIRILSNLNIFFLGVNTLHFFSGGSEDSYGKFHHEYSLANANREDFESIINESRVLAEQNGIPFQSYINPDIEWQRRTTVKSDFTVTNQVQSKDLALSPFYCFYPWTTLYLSADRSTQVCCYMFENFGEFSDASDLDAIWYGQGPFAEIRKAIQKGSVHPACKICVDQGNYKQSHFLVEAVKNQLA